MHCLTTFSSPSPTLELPRLIRGRSSTRRILASHRWVSTPKYWVWKYTRFGKGRWDDQWSKHDFCWNCLRVRSGGTSSPRCWLLLWNCWKIHQFVWTKRWSKSQRFFFPDFCKVLCSTAHPVSSMSLFSHCLLRMLKNPCNWFLYEEAGTKMKHHEKWKILSFTFKKGPGPHHASDISKIRVVMFVIRHHVHI